MSDVSAVSVSPTCAVPLMDGAPVAGVLVACASLGASALVVAAAKAHGPGPSPFTPRTW